MPSATPRVLFCVDRPNWAFDITARHLAARIPAESHIAYMADRPGLDLGSYDLVHVFFWGERWLRRDMARLRGDRPVLVREISSHRWEHERQYGPHSPAEAVERYMWDADTLAVTSRRLLDAFGAVHPMVRHYPLGVDTTLFTPGPSRAGALRFAWVGNPKDPLKRFAEIVRPLQRTHRVRTASKLAPAALAEFYRKSDVILVTSVAEGTPLPLLEAMASGAFVVATDVGVVPEVVRQGGGLVVEPTREAFAAALDWCAANPAAVRAGGAANAALIRGERSWDNSARAYWELAREGLSAATRWTGPQPQTKGTGQMTEQTASAQLVSDYHVHLRTVNPGGASDDAYRAASLRYREDFTDVLPTDKGARILDIGSGFGHFARWLCDAGYSRVGVIDNNAELLAGVAASVGDKLEFHEVADATGFMTGTGRTFDLVFMSDVIEHFAPQDAVDALAAIRGRLAPGGGIVLRTPNMANALGCYSLAIDLTHHRCYTEQSLAQLLRAAGYTGTQTLRRRPKGILRRAAGMLNDGAHKALFRLQDRSMPTCFDKNLVVVGRI